MERRRQLVERQPILGRLKIALADGAPAGGSWSKGAVGEEKFGAALAAMSDTGLLVLHDRRIPGSKANIDHLVVTPAGVWVVDAKRMKGLIECVDNGGWFRTDLRLRVRGRDQTEKLVGGVHRQVDQVTNALADGPVAGVQVRGALCFVDAEFRLFAKPFAVQGVVVTWGKALRERLLLPGPIDPEQAAAVHRHLARSFPPAV